MISYCFNVKYETRYNILQAFPAQYIENIGKNLIGIWRGQSGSE